MSVDRCNHRAPKYKSPKDSNRYTSKGIKITGSDPIALRSR
ncbi:hypothetical protein [Laspinema sp. D2d]|nr:hypothetical protein [Laspinema sp. D2d]